MDKVFNAKLVKPTDPGFVYDKRIDFAQSGDLDNSWDEDEDF